MKSQRGRRVEIEVDVVRQVESPEERHAMIRTMPPPQRVVHENHGQNETERFAERSEVEQAESVIRGPLRSRDQKRCLKKSENRE